MISQFLEHYDYRAMNQCVELQGVFPSSKAVSKVPHMSLNYLHAEKLPFKVTIWGWTTAGYQRHLARLAVPLTESFMEGQN